MTCFGIFNSYNTYCAPPPLIGGCCRPPIIPMGPIFGGCCMPPIMPMMYGGCGFNNAAFGAGLGYGLGMALPNIIDGVCYLGGKLWDGACWLGQKAWDGISWLGGKIWDGMCWIGRGIKNIFT